jgi:hypothetical protein
MPKSYVALIRLKEACFLALFDESRPTASYDCASTMLREIERLLVKLGQMRQEQFFLANMNAGVFVDCFGQRVKEFGETIFGTSFNLS